MNEIVKIYTDGSCCSNPGCGGWAALLMCQGKEKELVGFEAMTTNNRMEMMAVIESLQALKKPCQVEIYTDSKYVADGASQWLDRWRQKNFCKADGKPIKNKDLWQRISLLLGSHNVRFLWVRGHNGCLQNERVDQLAKKAANSGRQKL